MVFQGDRLATCLVSISLETAKIFHAALSEGNCASMPRDRASVLGLLRWHPIGRQCWAHASTRHWRTSPYPALFVVHFKSLNEDPAYTVMISTHSVTAEQVPWSFAPKQTSAQYGMPFDVKNGGGDD